MFVALHWIIPGLVKKYPYVVLIRVWGNTPFASAKNSHFQNKGKCKTFLEKITFICTRIKIIFISMASHLASV